MLILLLLPTRAYQRAWGNASPDTPSLTLYSTIRANTRDSWPLNERTAD